MSVSRQVHIHLFWIVHAQVRRNAVIALKPLADAQVDRVLWADNYTKAPIRRPLPDMCSAAAKSR